MQRLNFILALCILGSTSVFAQDEDAQTVTATGFGAILSGDRAKARDDAIQNALREAIQQVVGQMITSETVVENFTLLSDRVYSKTNGYIRTHKVIDEKSHPDEIEITVEAVVMQGSLENDLMGIDELLDRLRHPRIMVIIDEQVVITGSDSTALPVTNTAEAAIRESLLAKGFDVVDYKTIQQNLKRDQTIAASRGDATAAMALGRQYEAEVVITGRATATQAQLSESLAKILGSMKSFQANLTAQAIRVNSGALIAQARPAQEASPHINPMTAGVQAIQKAAGPLTDELMRKILVRWQAENMSGRTITLVVHKVAFTQLLDFKDRLMQFIRGVKSVTQRRYTDNTATLEVVFTGTGLDLATELARKDLGTIKMQVVNVLDGQVDVEVLKE